MGQWVSSREFAESKSISLRALQLKIQRNKQKIFSVNTYFFMYLYENGIGRGGKVLRIWSEPFESEAAALAFIESYTQERVAHILHTHSATTDCAIKLDSTTHALDSTLSHTHTEHICALRDTHSTLQSHIKAQSSSEITTPTTLTTPRKIGTLHKNDKAFISSSESIHLGKSKNTYASDDRDTDDVLSALKQERYTHNLSAFDRASQKQKNIAL
ncbi:hypothetical protein OQH61_09425, partial [Helicobacter sp. MIT 21-1697]|uniref:hypothetical protein n=1 Tax=Helicobacter sp. MIT 21-1697 TaxID=2993733 RepID=UPI00224B5932